MYKIRDNLPKKSRLDYYYAYIYPYLAYNTIIWGSAYPTNLKPLFLQQKRVVRTLVNAGFRDHTDPHFKDLKLLKIKDIYNFQLGCHMFHARARGEYATQTNYHTRGTNLARPTHHRLASTQHSISYAGPKFWSSLPPDLRSLNNFRRFKKSLREHLIDKYF